MKKLEDFLAENCLSVLFLGFIFILVPKIIMYSTPWYIYGGTTELIRTVINIFAVIEFVSILLFIGLLSFGLIYIFIKNLKKDKDSKVYKCFKGLFVTFAEFFFVCIAINFFISLLLLLVHIKIPALRIKLRPDD